MPMKMLARKEQQATNLHSKCKFSHNMIPDYVQYNMKQAAEQTNTHTHTHKEDAEKKKQENEP